MDDLTPLQGDGVINVLCRLVHRCRIVPLNEYRGKVEVSRVPEFKSSEFAVDVFFGDVYVFSFPRLIYPKTEFSLLLVDLIFPLVIVEKLDLYVIHVIIDAQRREKSIGCSDKKETHALALVLTVM